MCYIGYNTSIANHTMAERRLGLILTIDFESESPIYMQIRD